VVSELADGGCWKFFRKNLRVKKLIENLRALGILLIFIWYELEFSCVNENISFFIIQSTNNELIIEVMKKLIVYSVAFFILLSLNSCEEPASQYEGTWSGTSSQNLPISFTVNRNGFIESLEISVNCSYPAPHVEYLKSNSDQITDGSSVSYCNNFMGSLEPEEVEVLTELYLTFSSNEKATGYIDPYTYEYSYMSGSKLVVGSTTLFPKITLTANKN